MFEHRKLVHLSRTLWQNYRAYNICKSINWSYWFCRFQMCLTLLCICYGSRVINVFARSLTFKIHPKVERGKSWNFERTLCQNNRAYDSCTNINRSHLLCRFQICLTLYCSFYGSRVINVFAKSLKIKIHDFDILEGVCFLVEVDLRHMERAMAIFSTSQVAPSIRGLCNIINLNF